MQKRRVGRIIHRKTLSVNFKFNCHGPAVPFQKSRA
jgi:hypothetical protein